MPSNDVLYSSTDSVCLAHATLYVLTHAFQNKEAIAKSLLYETLG